MARYEHLPLFKDVYDFNLHFFKLSRGFPKDIKYGLGLEVKEQTSLLLEQVIVANNNADKKEYLKKAERCIEVIKIKTRMLKDLEVLSVKSYSFIIGWLINISKQVTAWKAWSEKER